MTDWNMPEGFHELAAVGRFVFAWKEDGNSVKLFSKNNCMWQYVLDENMTMGQLDEILEAFDYDLAKEEVTLLVQCGVSIDSWLEWAPSDLARYNEVGVSF